MYISSEDFFLSDNCSCVPPAVIIISQWNTSEVHHSLSLAVSLSLSLSLCRWAIEKTTCSVRVIV